MTSQIGTQQSSQPCWRQQHWGLALLYKYFHLKSTNGEDALEVAKIKAFFSLDSAVCIRKPLLRWKGWKKQEGRLHLFKELSAASSEYNVPLVLCCEWLSCAGKPNTWRMINDELWMIILIQRKRRQFMSGFEGNVILCPWHINHQVFNLEGSWIV